MNTSAYADDHFAQTIAIPDLAYPPRHVPLGVRIIALFHGVLNLMGWIWLLFSLVFVAVFVPKADFDFIRFRMSDTAMIVGEIVRTENTGSTSNDRYVYANRYVFRLPATEDAYYGVSYAEGLALQVGEPIRVEYLVDKPQVSRIPGMRSSEFGPAVLFVLIFPIIGWIMVWYSIKRGLKANRLLSHGLATAGRISGRFMTNTQINNRYVYRIKFEFADANGQPQQGETRTTRPDNWRVGEAAAVLYDPANPTRSDLIDNLPGGVGFDAFGNLRQPGMSALAWAILPTITVAGYLAVLVKLILP